MTCANYLRMHVPVCRRAVCLKKCKLRRENHPAPITQTAGRVELNLAAGFLALPTAVQRRKVRSGLAHQLANYLAVGANLDRLAGPIEERCRGINPELVIHRRDQILRP